MKFRYIGMFVCAVAIAVSGALAPAAQAGKKVKPGLLSLHSFHQKPGVPTGSLRLNCTPLWRDVEVKKGVYNWSEFDQIVERDRNSWGVSDLMYVPCGTPEWAAGKVKAASSEVFGPKSSAPPKKMSYFKNYMKAVVKRYSGKIAYYQAWNEVTSPQFFQGSPKKMAKMTKVLKDVVKKFDKNAKVVSGSVQTHDSKYDAFAPAYFRALKKQKWPIHALAAHFYTPGKGGPDQRMKQIQMVKKDLSQVGMPKKVKLWDTESNYNVGYIDSGTPNPEGRIRGNKAATYTARTFLDGLRLGVQRNYFYLWTTEYAEFSGVQLRAGDPSTAAWQTLYGWIVGAKYKGCDTKGKLVKCDFKKQGSNFQIAFTTKKKAKMKTKGKEVCPVYGGSCTSSKKTTIKKMPVRIGKK
jgi:hypothetical protein